MCSGRVSSGWVRHGRLGAEWFGAARWGKVRQVWLGMERCVMAWSGIARQVRHGAVRRVGFGGARQVRYVWAGCVRASFGMLRQVGQGADRCVSLRRGELWQVWRGGVWQGAVQ